MADNRDKKSVFTPLAVLTVLLLGATAVVAWLQQNETSAADPAAAVLSQSIALHANRVQAGDTGAVSALAEELAQLERLQQRTDTLPGSRANWQALAEGGAGVVAGAAALESVERAAGEIEEATPALLAAAADLLSVSGATAAIQQLEERAMRLATAAATLTDSDDPAAVVSAINDDLGYLQQVGAALAGEPTALDIAALDEAQRATALAPLEAALAEIAANAATLRDNAPALAGSDAASSKVMTASGQLRRHVAAAPGSQVGGVLASPYLLPGLALAALLMVLGLLVLHGRNSVFERAAQVQAEQNERNQQAILRLLDELGSLADGDLTVEATVTEDITGAIADSINYAIEKLRELVATINETAIMVDSAAKQTESTAVHMARAADNQNREIQAATDSIVSMAASIEEVSGNAERSSDVARHSVDVAHKGGEAVRRTIDGMNTIRETIQDTSKRIKRLGESSQEIGNIIELINDIAEQTNILALNASIQASMAGEAGRGFAVVADEVQRLAERSTNATRQIEVLVRTIQADTNEAVVSMERSTTDVVGGALLAENAGAALDEIEQVSNQIASLVQNISSSAREQAGSAADVTQRTTRLKEISEQTGKATTATAAAISKLSELASQLRNTVAGFTLPKAALEAQNLAASAEFEAEAGATAHEDQAAV